MTKNIFLAFALICISEGFAQEIFMQTGKNYTTYDFKSIGDNSNVKYRASSGDFYEFGLNYPMKDSKIGYSVSVTYNELNAAASNGATNYTWNTSYLGLQNKVSYAFFEADNGLIFFLDAGVNTATIIKGSQMINTVYYDVKKQEEFSGILLQPSLGFEAKYSVSSKMLVSLGYHYAKAFNLSNSSDEKVTFNTNQIQFGLHVPLQ